MKANPTRSIGNSSSSATLRITLRAHRWHHLEKTSSGDDSFRNTDNDSLLEASSDWISPGVVNADDAAGEAYITDPPAADGKRVSILDSDHLFFT